MSAKMEQIGSRKRPPSWDLANVVGTTTTKTPSSKESADVPWNHVVNIAGLTFACNRSSAVCQICFAFTRNTPWGKVFVDLF